MFKLNSNQLLAVQIIEIDCAWFTYINENSMECYSKNSLLTSVSEKKHSKNMVPNFTVKRSFTLKNTGKLPFYVHGYNINNSPCEGYGFRVLECEGFEMLPNTSRKIDIA